MRSSLRRHPLEHAWKGNSLAHVVQAAEPSHHARDAHAEAGVRDRAVAPEIQVPRERVFREIIALAVSVTD